MSSLLRAIFRQDGPYFPADFPEAGRRVFRRNYIGNTVDGGFYNFGTTLVSFDAVLPALLSSLGAPSVLIGFVPQLVTIGFSLPPVFTAHKVASMRRVHRWVCKFGVWQRLPYLLAGLALLAGNHLPRELVIAIVFITPLVAALFGGVSIGAWNALIARCFPPARRPSSMAMRNILGALLGLTSGAIVTAMLERVSAPVSYGFLHLIAFAALAVSFWGFSSMREPDVEYPTAPRRGFRESLPEYIEALRTERNLRAYLVGRIFNYGSGLLAPFIVLQALALTKAGGALIGHMTLAAVAGRMLGNVISLTVGDRFGSKLLSRFGMSAMLLAALATPFARTEFAFLVVFFTWSFGQITEQTGASAILLSIAPHHKVAAYVSIQSICTLPFVLLIGGLAGAVYTFGRHVEFGAGILLSAWLAALALGLALIFMSRVHPEPHGTE